MFFTLHSKALTNDLDVLNDLKLLYDLTVIGSASSLGFEFIVNSDRYEKLWTLDYIWKQF